MIPGADRDPVIAYGLAKRIKYVRLARRTIQGRLQRFAQMECEGVPMRKMDLKTGRFLSLFGSETQGLDIGPSTMAIVGETQAELRNFADAVTIKDGLSPENTPLRSVDGNARQKTGSQNSIAGKQPIARRCMANSPIRLSPLAS